MLKALPPRQNADTKKERQDFQGLAPSPETTSQRRGAEGARKWRIHPRRAPPKTPKYELPPERQDEDFQPIAQSMQAKEFALPATWDITHPNASTAADLSSPFCITGLTERLSFRLALRSPAAFCSPD